MGVPDDFLRVVESVSEICYSEKWGWSSLWPHTLFQVLEGCVCYTLSATAYVSPYHDVGVQFSTRTHYSLGARVISLG